MKKLDRQSETCQNLRQKRQILVKVYFLNCCFLHLWRTNSPNIYLIQFSIDQHPFLQVLEQVLPIWGQNIPCMCHDIILQPVWNMFNPILCCRGFQPPTYHNFISQVPDSNTSWGDIFRLFHFIFSNLCSKRTCIDFLLIFFFKIFQNCN